MHEEGVNNQWDNMDSVGFWWFYSAGFFVDSGRFLWMYFGEYLRILEDSVFLEVF